MKFIDHTGHLFQLKSYSVNPIGYEYETTKYIFWFNNEQGYKISVDTYAILPIRVLLEDFTNDEESSIEIILDSKKFSLISSLEVQNKLESLSSMTDKIIFDESNEDNLNKGIFVQSLSKDQLFLISNLKSFTQKEDINYTLVPFYVAVKSDEAGTWQTNALIHVKYNDIDEEWCPISISAEIVDECEELIINGQNMGVKLPKEILKAIYQTSYYNNVPDERLYSQKLKEYLMNFMDIKGQTGNYKSALTGLKWFGWGDKLDVYKLLKTDNELQSQYIRDKFDITTDILYTYKYFKNDALLSISLSLDEETGETSEFDFSQPFWGEGKPILSNLETKEIIVHYDEEDLDFYKSYFDFSINEIGLKLCMLKYYYEKYFLPLHLALNSVSVVKHVYTNDIKLVQNCYPKITAEPVFIKDNNINVVFPSLKTLVFKPEYHCVDENFIEFNQKSIEANSESNMFYNIYESLINVPIKFISKNYEQYYDIILSLYKDDTIIYSRNFQFSQIDLINNESFNFIIYPKIFNRYLGGNSDNIENEKFSLNLWLDSTYTINILVNGNTYSYKFNINIPDMILKFGKLVYKYDDRFRQLISETNVLDQISNQTQELRFLSYMHMPNLVNVNNIDFIDDLYFYQDSLGDYIDKYYKTHINTIDRKYLNKCHLYKLYIKEDENSIKHEIEYQVSNSQYNIQYEIGGTNFILDIEKSLYKIFFNDDGFWKLSIDHLDDHPEYNLYDFYLMHSRASDEPDNKSYWYVILISKNTCSEILTNDYIAPNIIDIVEDEKTYSFEYIKSDEKLLINRFILEDTNGKNQFNDNDIIVFYLASNKKLMYKIGLTTKWLIQPMSIGMKNDVIIESPNEIAIVSIGDTNFKYQKGYYSIVCRYSLDDYFQEKVEKKGIFMVK